MFAARPPLLGDHSAAAEALHVDAGHHQVARLGPGRQDRVHQGVDQGPKTGQAGKTCGSTVVSEIIPSIQIDGGVNTRCDLPGFAK